MQLYGYSGTPLVKKLGIKERFIMSIINAPENYLKLLTDLPDDVEIVNDPKSKKDFIHFFVQKEADLIKKILLLKNQIKSNGMIWISWPKKASKVMTDITEDVIRKIALDNGLVDVKVCAVDETWSGLKLVIPVKERKR
ncbi:MAG: DUF3052 family protein [Chitinophagaceae bacterium]